jgi:hypothetical protein
MTFPLRPGHMHGRSHLLCGSDCWNSAHSSVCAWLWCTIAVVLGHVASGQDEAKSSAPPTLRGWLTILALCFREYAGAYALDYQDADDHRGMDLETVLMTEV